MNPWNLPRIATLGTATLLLAACAATPPSTPADAATIAAVFQGQQARQNVLTRLWHDADARGLQCLAFSRPEALGKTLAPAVEGALSPDELREAGAFLATPAGRHYADLALGFARTPRALTANETYALTAFRQTPAGRKLFDPALGRQQEAALAAIVADPPGQCGPVQTAKRQYTHKDLGCQVPNVRYPAVARARNETGTTVVRFWLTQQGQVYLTVIDKSSGFVSLDEEASRAVRAMQCTPPAVIDGEPFRGGTGAQPFAFRLQ